MVQNANLSQNKRGRRPAFDRSTVVAAAVRTFWSKGFSSTTLNDLEVATGVDRSTLYNSFDGKEGLYRSAAAAYVDLAEQELFASLFNGTDGIADIVEFIDRLDEVFRSGARPRGCLIINDLASDVDDHASKRYLRSLEEGLRLALERASESGETDPNKALHRSQFLTAAVLGFSLVSRNSVDQKPALALIDGVRSEVSSWILSDRSPPPATAGERS